MDHSFNWHERLHLREDFTRVFRTGRRFQASGLVMWFLVRKDRSDERPRLGLLAPRTYGHAVARNRLKRLLREVFRTHKHELKSGVDMVLGARRPLSKPTFQSIESGVLKLWTSARLRLPSPER